MKLLKMIGIAFFFLHYYVVIALATLKNALYFVWKMVTQNSPDKHHVSPFAATHPHVFAPICISQ
jgi:hypothetical protein